MAPPRSERIVIAAALVAAVLAIFTGLPTASGMGDYDYDYEVGMDDVEYVMNATCPMNVSEDWWFDCFAIMEGDSANCGGASVNGTVAGKHNTNRTYCDASNAWCPPHLVISGSNMSTHILKDDMMFGLPVAFGNATISFDLVVSSMMNMTVSPILRLYHDCNGTTMSTTFRPTSSMPLMQGPMCGEMMGMSQYRLFTWADISTMNFTMGATFALEWEMGAMGGNVLRVYKFGLAVDKPYRWRKSLIAPECNGQLQHATCSALEGMGMPMSRRARKPIYQAPTALERQQRRRRRRAEPPGPVCTGGGPTSYLLLIVQTSNTVRDNELEYLQALEAFVTELEELPVGIAVIDFDGPSSYWGGMGMTSDDARWITPVDGSSGVYRMMDNPLDVTQLLADIQQVVFGGGSNWEAGFDLGKTLNPVPNNTVFLTDGDPTAANGWCYSDDSRNSDFYASLASVDANALKDSGSRIIPLLVGDNLDETFLVNTITSDGHRRKIRYCSNPPNHFANEEVIGSPVSGNLPLLEGVDYFYAPNYAAVAGIVQGNLTIEVCSEPETEQTPSISQSQSQSHSESQSRSRSQSASHSASTSRSASPEEYVVEVDGSIVTGVGPGLVPCQVDQSQFWYDAFGGMDTGGDAVVCGGSLSNTVVVGKTYNSRRYCLTLEDCPAHVLYSGSNLTTHVLSDNSLFGVPTAFGTSTVSMTFFFSGPISPTPLPSLVLYSDCNGTTSMTEFPFDSLSDPGYNAVCGDDSGTTRYYRYTWDSIPTTNFAEGATLGMYWAAGMDMDTDIRVYEWYFTVSKPRRIRTWLEAPVCDAQLQNTHCPAESEPEARRRPVAPQVFSGADFARRREGPAEMCVTSNETSYVLLILDASGSVEPFLDEYISATLAFVDVLEGSPVGIAALEFFGPTGVTEGSTNDADWLTPLMGSSGEYRFMNVPADVTMLRDELLNLGAGGSTNWEAAFQLANTLTPVPNITFFLTDGNPTVSVDYCFANNFNNYDFYSSVAADDADVLMQAGSKIVPLLIGNINVQFATTLVESDNAATGNFFCQLFGGNAAETSFTPTAIIATNMSGADPLVDGVDYYTTPNATALAGLILDLVEQEICTPVSSSQSQSQSTSNSRVSFFYVYLFSLFFFCAVVCNRFSAFPCPKE